MFARAHRVRAAGGLGHGERMQKGRPDESSTPPPVSLSLSLSLSLCLISRVTGAQRRRGCAGRWSPTDDGGWSGWMDGRREGWREARQLLENQLLGGHPQQHTTRTHTHTHTHTQTRCWRMVGACVQHFQCSKARKVCSLIHPSSPSFIHFAHLSPGCLIRRPQSPPGAKGGHGGAGAGAA